MTILYWHDGNDHADEWWMMGIFMGTVMGIGMCIVMRIAIGIVMGIVVETVMGLDTCSCSDG